MPNKEGRPTKFTQDLADQFCEEVATSTDSIRTICKKHDKFPTGRTIFNWLRERPEFFHQYARAKEMQMELMSEEILAIADDREADLLEGDDGKQRVDYENIQRAKLRVDTRKWLMSKLAPRYHKKQDIDVTSRGEQIQGSPIVRAHPDGPEPDEL